MRKAIVGTRTGPLFCMDMACKLVPADRPRWYGHGFAIGDRAWTHVWMLDWRKRHPDHRLILTDRGHRKVSLRSWAGPLDARWLGEGIVDEIWETEYAEEAIPDPQARRLYHTSMGRIWKWLRKHCVVKPTIRPKSEAMERARVVLKRYGVPERFMTVQPLFDATYNTYRNASPEWWSCVCRELSSVAPVVVLGAQWNAMSMVVPPKAIPVWLEPLTAMETLAIVSQAAVHVGGETGVTIWAPIFGVPTVAVYRTWSGWENDFQDVRPISFGSPVVPAKLGGLPSDVTRCVADLWRH